MVLSLAFAYLIVSRAAYVLGIGVMLRRQERDETYTKRYGVRGGYEHFRRVSSWLMVNDSIAFIALCVATFNTLHVPVPRAVLVVVGLVVGVFGIAVKAWATARLGTESYYWHNFFVPTDPKKLDPPGPYRYFKNPMYGVGYLQTYGLALVCASWPGLVASVYMQACIMIFNELVEKPHFESLVRRAATRRAAPRESGVDPHAAARIG